MSRRPGFDLMEQYFFDEFVADPLKGEGSLADIEETMLRGPGEASRYLQGLRRKGFVAYDSRRSIWYVTDEGYDYLS